ncbi:MAG: low molecular weight phosphotyrosine protein phosphatase [Acholeplasmatales bacterium]|nr:low molecular weight phosphotyrosine protein phosphatase [Acholeplasmatales bacterium]
MIKVVFVCHGNICRSPMAEYLFKYYVFNKGTSDKFIIDSMATSTEEIGNGVHMGTRQILDKFNIDYSRHKSIQIKSTDYDKYDFIIAMDRNNIYNLKRIFLDKDNKVHLFLEYAGINRDISDPWYTGNFDDTYRDIKLGIEAFYKYLIKNGYLN